MQPYANRPCAPVTILIIAVYVSYFPHTYLFSDFVILYGAALMLLLGILDILFVNHACHSIITRGASVQLVFGFEVWK